MTYEITYKPVVRSAKYVTEEFEAPSAHAAQLAVAEKVFGAGTGLMMNLPYQSRGAEGVGLGVFRGLRPIRHGVHAGQSQVLGLVAISEVREA